MSLTWSNPSANSGVTNSVKSGIKNNSTNEKDIRYLTGASPRGESLECRVNELKKKLPDFIPTGMSIQIIILKEEQKAGRNIHNRFILTERGGIKFPYGLDIQRNDERSDDVNYMDEDLHREKFAEYYELKGYDIGAEFNITGRKKY